MRVGVLSDTHGLLRPRVLELLAGCDRILHAGDVGSPEILARLREIAPLAAVRGNTDGGEVAAELPATLAGDLAGLPFRMIHQREDADPGWPRHLRLLVYGHTHRPEMGLVFAAEPRFSRCLFANWSSPPRCRLMTRPLQFSSISEATSEPEDVPWSFGNGTLPRRLGSVSPP